MAKSRILSKEELDKKYGSDSYIVLDEEENLSQIPRLPCRILALNHMLGGGLPYGKITESFGYESTGKSLLAYDFAYSAQQLGGVALIVDAENAFEIAWARKNGLDPARTVIYSESAVEKVADWARDQILYWRSELTNNEPIFLLVDSIAVLECMDNQEADMTNAKAEMGNRAKAIGKFYRTRNKLFKKTGTVVYMINQVRKKLGASMFESSETTPGGDATKFYASIRMGLIRSTQIKGFVNKDGEFIESKEKGRKIGQNIIVKTEKNKVSPPRPQLKTEVYFTPEKFGYTGFNRYIGLDDILIEEGVIEKKGSRYYYKGEMIANGEANFLQMIHTKPKRRAKLVAKSSINTISKTRELLESLPKNTFSI